MLKDKLENYIQSAFHNLLESGFLILKYLKCFTTCIFPFSLRII